MDDVLYLAALAAGFVALYFGANWLVNGAAAISDALGIPKSVVGLTLVAFGTSAPELFVNVIAGVQGETQIALANVSGSNLTNICLGFGLCAILASVQVSRREFRADLGLLVVSAGLILGLLLLSPGQPSVPWWSAMPLLAVLMVYLAFLWRRVRKHKSQIETAGKPDRWHLLLNFGLFALGVGSLYAGGELILLGAVGIADAFHIEKPLIGLTIIAAGTSIPDVVASIIAARKGHHGIAVGNLLGSNISNILLVLSATIVAAGSSLPANTNIIGDYVMVCAVSILFVAIAAITTRINRAWGVALLGVYFAYMTFRVYTVLAGGA